MFKGFMMHINNVIDACDLIFELVDARHPEETRNYEIEKKILRKKKKLISPSSPMGRFWIPIQ